MQSAPGHQPGPLCEECSGGNESSKVDKPPIPQTKRTTLDSLKPSNPKGVQGSHGVGGASTSPTRAAPDQDPASASSVSEPTESPRASTPSPWSHGLRAAGGSQHGEGSSMPQPKEVP
jgi:hypothetical protein